MMVVTAEQHEKISQAARAVVRAGLATAFGHCSLRLDSDHFLVSTGKALSTIGAGDLGTVVPVRGDLPAGALGEVRAHQQIYALRPDVGGVVRCLPPNVVSLSAMGKVPRIRHGVGAYFAPQAGYWADPGLIRSEARAEGVARALGSGTAVIMRGNGAVTAGETLEQAIALAYFLEDAARVELDMIKAGQEEAPCLSDEQIAERVTWQGNIAERLWAHLTA